ELEPLRRIERARGGPQAHVGGEHAADPDDGAEDMKGESECGHGRSFRLANSLVRDRLILNREFKLRSSPRMRGPRLCRKNWVPASAGTNGDGPARSNHAPAVVTLARGLVSSRFR